jgi:hypothetical protein
MATHPKPSIEIFVSHAVKDTDIVYLFVDLLRLGCDVSDKVVFCSSLGGIPNGDYFVQTILHNLDESQVVLCLLSQDYFDSTFCLAEVGAAQLRQHAQAKGATFTLVVPPLGFDALKGVLFGVQSGKINDPNTLEDLRTFIKDHTGREASGRTWTRARDAFLRDVVPPVHAREMRELLREKLRVVEADLERLSDAQIKQGNIKFTRKFRVVFRNETGRQININRAELRCSPTDARPDPRIWYGLQLRGAGGAWGTDNNKVSVPPGETFRAGVAFDTTYRIEELDLRWLNNELGSIALEVDIGGTVVEYIKRL